MKYKIGDILIFPTFPGTVRLIIAIDHFSYHLYPLSNNQLQNHVKGVYTCDINHVDNDELVTPV